MRSARAQLLAEPGGGSLPRGAALQVARIEEGLRQAAAGNLIKHSEVVSRLRKRMALDEAPQDAAGRSRSGISDYLIVAGPRAREQLLERLDHLTDFLLDFPLMGKPGIVPETRHFVLTGTPYVLVLQIKDDTVIIVSVRDGRMRLPSRELNGMLA